MTLCMHNLYQSIPHNNHRNTNKDTSVENMMYFCKAIQMYSCLIYLSFSICFMEGVTVCC